MNGKPGIVFFHNPHSRACMTRALLEELGADYELCTIDFRQHEQLSDEYRAINPMGKVPAIRHGDAVVTETVAIYIYLADLFAAAGLTPAVGDPDRGPWLRWLVFYAACFEPALVDRVAHRDPPPRAQSPYADFDTVLATLTAQLEAGPWLLGERFSAADVLWGNALAWVTGFGLVPATPVISAYIERLMARPAQQRAAALDRELVAQMGLAA